MSLVDNDPRKSMIVPDPQMESLEERLLLTTLVGGDYFEYIDAQNQTIRVSLSGDVIVELIGLMVDPRDNSLIFSDVPGQLYGISPTGDHTGFRGGSYINGYDVLGGPGGEKGIEFFGNYLVQGINIISGDPLNPDPNIHTEGSIFWLEGGVDEINIQAIASTSAATGGFLYGFNVATIEVTDPASDPQNPTTTDLDVVQLLRIDPATQQATVIAELQSVLPQRVENGVITYLTQAVTAADFRPSTGSPNDGLLYFVIQADAGFGLNSYLYTVNVNYPDSQSIIDSVQGVGAPAGTHSVPPPMQFATVGSIAFDQVSPTQSVIWAYGNTTGGNAPFENAAIFRINPDTGGQVSPPLPIFGGGATNTPFRVTEVSGGETVLVMDITGLAFVDDDPNSAEQFLYVIRSVDDGRIDRIRLYEVDADGNIGYYTNAVPTPMGLTHADPLLNPPSEAGANLGSLTWNPVLLSPFTGEYGVLVATDTETDQLVYVDHRLRPAAANAFLIYVSQASNDASISIAVVPAFDPENPDDLRYMDPYSGGTTIRVIDLTTGELVDVSTPDGTGGVYIGARYVALQDDDTLANVPIFRGDLDRQMGVRPIHMGEFSTDFSTDAGIYVAQSILRYISSSPNLANRLLGRNLDNIGAMSVSRDGRIVVVDVDGRNQNLALIGNDQLSFVNPNSGRATGYLYEVVQAGSMLPLFGIQGMDYGDLDFSGVEELYAIYGVWNNIPLDSLANLGANYNIVDLAVNLSGVMYAINDTGEGYQILRITRTGVGTVLVEPVSTILMASVAASMGGTFTAGVTMLDLVVNNAGQMYGVGTAAGVLGWYQVNPSAVNGSTSLGAIQVGGTAINNIQAVDFGGGNYYVVGIREGGANYELFTINPANGAATSVATLNGAGYIPSLPISALAYNDATGMLIGAYKLPNDVYIMRTINPVTGAVASFGSEGGRLDVDGVSVSDMGGMDFNPAGDLLAVNKTTGRLIHINLADPSLSTWETPAGTALTTFVGLASDSAGAFYAVNPATPGVWSVPVAILEDVTAIDFSASNGLVFAAGSKLYTYNLVNNQMTVVPGFDIGNPIVALAYSKPFISSDPTMPSVPNGKLYLVVRAVGGDTLYEVNPVNYATRSLGIIEADLDGDGAGDQAVAIESMDFDPNNDLILVDRGPGAGTGRLLRILAADSTANQPLGSRPPIPVIMAYVESAPNSVSADMKGYASDPNGRFYSINNVSDQLYISPGGQSVLGILTTDDTPVPDPNNPEIVRYYAYFSPIGVVEVSGVNAMAFAPYQSVRTGLQALYVVDTLGVFHEIDPTNGDILTSDYIYMPTADPEEPDMVMITAMDFDRNGNLFGLDYFFGRLVDISFNQNALNDTNPLVPPIPAMIGFTITVEAGANTKTSSGSFRPTVGDMAYDFSRDRFLAVDNSTGAEYLGRADSAAESAVLMELWGTKSDSPAGQTLGTVLVGGAVTGQVYTSGSFGLLYAGWFFTVNGVYISGDVQNLISNTDIGWGSWDPSNPYESGIQFDSVIQVRGKVGMIFTPAAFVSQLIVENQSDVPGYKSNTPVREFEQHDIDGITEDDGYYFERGLLYNGTVFQNNTQDQAQYLGSTQNVQDGQADRIIVTGTIASLASVVAEIDYYAVGFLAGQTITVRLDDTSTRANEVGWLAVYVYDSDGRLIATDISNVDPQSSSDQEFRFTTDRAGIYYFEITKDFSTHQETTNADGIAYTLYIDNEGDITDPNDKVRAANMAIGGIHAPVSLVVSDLHNIGIQAQRGNIGALVTEGDYVTWPGMMTVQTLDGDLNAIRAARFGYSNGGDPLPGYKMLLNVSGDVGRLETLLPWDGEGFMLLDAFVGGNIQWIDCAGNLDLGLTVNGGIGVIRGALWSWNAAGQDTGSPRAGYIIVDADGSGGDGIIDLIDIAGDLGGAPGGIPGTGLGGPQITVNGGGGNVRYIRVGGAIYGDKTLGFQYDTWTRMDPGQSATLIDDSGGKITITPINDMLDPNTGEPLINPETGESEIAWLSYRSYPIHGPFGNVAGVVIMQVISTGGVSIRSDSNGNGAPVEIGQIIVGGAGRDVIATVLPTDGVDAEIPDTILDLLELQYHLAPDEMTNLNVRISGSAPVDVFEIIGAGLDEAALFTNGSLIYADDRGNFTTISNTTGGEIVSIVANSIGTLSSAGNIGIASNHTGQAILPLFLGGGGSPGRVSQAQAYADSYPFSGQTSGIVVGDVLTIRSEGAIGNVIAFGGGESLSSEVAYVGRITANSGGVVDLTDGRFNGIAAPIYVIGNIGTVQIGEGLAPSGSGGDVSFGGIYAHGTIGLVTNQGLGSDIYGNIVAARGINRISLTDGSIINANIMTFGTAYDYPGGAVFIDAFLPSNEFRQMGGFQVLANTFTGLGNITVSGQGGIIGSYIMSSFQMSNITVTGYGIFNSEIHAGEVGRASMGNTRAGGFGMGDVLFEGGYDFGDIIATGKGNLASTLNYSPTVRYSENYSWNPLFPTLRVSPLNDLHRNLGTSAANPMSVEGVMTDVIIRTLGNVGQITAYQINSGSPVNTMITPSSSFNVANTIKGITTWDTINGLSVGTGALKNFKPGGDVSRLTMIIAGEIKSIVITGSLLGDSVIMATGPNGYIRNVKISGSLDGDIIAYGTLGKIDIGGDLTGNIIAYVTNPDKLGLSSLRVGGSFGNGSMFINGNVGTVEVLGGLGSAGDTMHIVGDMKSLKVGTNKNVDGSSLLLDLDVVGNLDLLEVTGRIQGNVYVGGSMKTFTVNADSATAGTDIVTGQVTILGGLTTARINNGNLAADFTVGASLGSFTLTGGDLEAGFTLASIYGDIRAVTIKDGNVLGNIRAMNGVIGAIVIGNDLGGEVTADSIKNLRIAGSMLAGAAIRVDGQVDSLNIGLDLQAGAEVSIGRLIRMGVGRDLLGDLAAGYYGKGTQLTIGNDLGGNVNVNSTLTLSVGRNITGNGRVQVGYDLKSLTVGDTIFGAVLVEGASGAIKARTLDGAVLTVGFDLASLAVSGNMVRSLVQVGISRGEDGVFGTGDVGETGRMGVLKSLSIGGAMTNSIVAAGGDLLKAGIKGTMTNSSLSSGLNLGGEAIGDLLGQASGARLANVAALNTARSGADRQLFRGNLGAVSIGGAGMINSDVTAGIDAGADGDFDTIDASSITVSLTGGNSMIQSISAALDAASNVLSDAGIGKNSATGAGTVVANVTYTIADITTAAGNPLPALVATADKNTPIIYPTVGGFTVTITVKGNGFVDLHDVGGDNNIDGLVFRGTDSKTQVTITTSTPGAVTIGRMLTEDDTVVGSVTFDGDLIGDAVAATTDLWFDAPMNTLSFRAMANATNNWTGKIGGDVNGLSMQTQQGSAKLAVGGAVKSMTIVNSSGDPLLRALGGVVPGVNVTALSSDAAGVVWLFDSNGNQLARVNVATGALAGNVSVTDAISGNVLSLQGMDFLNSGNTLYGVAQMFNQSPTDLIGTMGAGLNLQCLAVSSANAVYAIDISTGAARLMRLNTTTGAAELIGTLKTGFVANSFTSVSAMAFGSDGQLYAIVPDGNGSISTGPYEGRATLVVIETTDANNDGYVNVHSSSSNFSYGQLLSDNDTYTAMAIDNAGLVWAIRDNAGNDELVTINRTTGVVTSIGMVQVDRGAGAVATRLNGIGFDSNANLIGYNIAAGGTEAELVKIDKVTPAASTLATVAGALNPNIDAFAISRSGGNRSTFAYDFDDVAGGAFYVNPGTVATLGVIDTATGRFLQLRGLAIDADGTPLTSKVLAISVNNFGNENIYVITDNGLLLQYSELDGSLVANLGTVVDASTLQALNVTAIDFDDVTGDLIGIDSFYHRLVSLDLLTAEATARTEVGSANGATLPAMTYDAISGLFYTFRSTDNSMQAFAGITQDAMGGIVLDSVDKLNIGGGAGYNGRIVARGNTFGTVTVAGDFSGALSTRSDIQSFTQTGGNFSGLLSAANIGKAFFGGHLAHGGTVVAEETVGQLTVAGNLGGDIRSEMMGKLTVNSAVLATADIEVLSGLGSMMVTNAFAGRAEIGSAGQIAIGGVLDTGAYIHVLGNAGQVTLSGGTASNSWLQVEGYLGTLTVGQVYSGVADLQRGLNSARLNNMTNGILAIGEDAGTIQINGTVDNSVISIGTWIGEDMIYNSADDVITGGSVKSIAINGNFRNSVIAAGVLPNLWAGAGVVTDKRAYTSNSSPASVSATYPAEAGGVLKSSIGSLAIKGNVINTSPATGQMSVVVTVGGIDKLSIKPGAALQRYQYNDPFGAPQVNYVTVPNNSEIRIYFTEALSTASFILSVDADGDGSVTGPADTLGSITITDSSGKVLSDLNLTYQQYTDAEGYVRSVLIIRNPSGFGDEQITVSLSGSLDADTPAIYDRSGLRSALRIIPGGDQAGTILDGNGDGTEGGNYNVVLVFGDVGDTFADAAAVNLVMDGGPLNVTTNLSYGEVADVYTFSGDQYRYFSVYVDSNTTVEMSLFYRAPGAEPDSYYYKQVVRFESNVEMINGVSQSVNLFQAVELPITGEYYLVVTSYGAAGDYSMQMVLSSTDELLVAELGGLPAGEQIAYVSNFVGQNFNDLGAQIPQQLVYLNFNGGRTTDYAARYGYEVNVAPFNLGTIDLDLAGYEDLLIDGGSLNGTPIVSILDHIMSIYSDTMAAGGTYSVEAISTLAEWLTATEGVYFTLVDPSTWGLNASTDYTTIFIGEEYQLGPGLYGLASQVDLANMDKSDNALVFSQNFAGIAPAVDIGAKLNQYSLLLGNIAAHELGHVLGLNHQPTSRELDTYWLLPDLAGGNAGSLALMAYAPNELVYTYEARLGTADLAYNEFPMGQIDTARNLLRWLA